MGNSKSICKHLARRVDNPDFLRLYVSKGDWVGMVGPFVQIYKDRNSWIAVWWLRWLAERRMLSMSRRNFQSSWCTAFLPNFADKFLWIKGTSDVEEQPSMPDKWFLFKLLVALRKTTYISFRTEIGFFDNRSRTLRPLSFSLASES